MKTNEEMLADLLERKKEYDIKRAATRRRISVLSAALALILIISTVTTAALIAVNKSSPAAPVVTDEQTENESVTNILTEYDKIQTDYSDLNIHYFDVIRTKISSEPEEEVCYNDVALEFSEKGVEAYCAVRYCLHEEIKEYEISITRAVDYVDKKAYLLIIPSISVELLSDDLILLDYENTETNTVAIKFRYKNGCTNGRIEYMILNEKEGLKLYSELDDHITKRGLGFSYENVYDMSIKFDQSSDKLAFYYDASFCFAKIKGYDFTGYVHNLGGKLASLYRFAANYFGDVDEKGIALFENDPYIPEYYDNPDCFNKRHMYEKAYEAGQQMQKSIEKVEGEEETSPNTLFSDLDNSKGGVLHQYNVSFYGIIGWTDSSNTTHYARNVTVAVYDTSDPTVALDSATTSEYGSYFLHFDICSLNNKSQ